MRTLNVMRIRPYILAKKWDVPLPLNWWQESYLYIRCNAKGKVNWDKAPVYFINQLQKRGSFQVHTFSLTQ